MKMRHIRFLLMTMAVVAVNGAAGQPSLTERVGWFDNDVSTLTNIGPSVAGIDVSGLAAGMHSLTMQVKDSQGKWSVPVTKFFVVKPAKVDATDIVTRKYWIDNDVDNRTDLQPSVASVDISALPVGLHSLTMHVQDNAGKWSLPVTKFFIMTDYSQNDNDIARCMYWFDDDVQNARVVEPAEASGIVDVEVTGLDAGKHILYWRVGDFKGVWSEHVYSGLFNYVVPSSGLGTFSADMSLALPEGLDAYYTSSELNYANGGRLFVKVRPLDTKVIPAQTGVVLNGTGGDTFILVQTDEQADLYEDNTLVPVVEPTHVEPVEGDFTNFMLKSGKFIRIAEANPTSTMPANRAYLQLPTDALNMEAAANGIYILWDSSETTGIGDNPFQSSSDNVYYDLQGRRVVSPKQGVYITRGKKVVVK